MQRLFRAHAAGLRKPSIAMKNFEYKTIELKLKGLGLFSAKRAEGFEGLLNEQGKQGWRYVDTVPQTGAYGEASKITLVFEREI